jgi:hypothetical protein
VSVVRFRPWAPSVKFGFDFAQCFPEEVPPGPSVGHYSVPFLVAIWRTIAALDTELNSH